jgi:P27 family predicted phage terminase small subunit
VRRKSANTKRLQGNAAGKEIAAPIEGVGDVLEPPKDFNAAQKAIWRVAVEFAPVNTLTASDLWTLRNWCVAASLHAWATKQMFKKGETLTADSTGGERVNPLIVIINKQAEIMLKHAKELGFTPASRSSIGAAGSGAFPVAGSLVSFKNKRPTFDA